ncbi:unnamed protein product [Durusdinium trenchii]|uniref:Uncharacterized protein n=2 Tax=Durusdinium trenchii TaxID=1381693 RepID=A0ABP0L7R6_9DINO
MLRCALQRRPVRPWSRMCRAWRSSATLPEPSTSELRRHFEDAHQWRMTEVFGDKKEDTGQRMVATPPSAAHVFISCAFLEGIFLCVNVGTFSPLIFEMFMPYHLKYTALVFAWWGGTYLGLNTARFGPLVQGPWIFCRTLAGPMGVTLGALGLVLADGVAGLGPWPSYWLMIICYSGMSSFDVALARRKLLPPWLLKWKLGISGLIVASLFFGVLKGRYLEKNAQRLILEAE